MQRGLYKSETRYKEKTTYRLTATEAVANPMTKILRRFSSSLSSLLDLSRKIILCILVNYSK